MFKCSICHPDQERIEELDRTFAADEVRYFIENYPWEDQLNLLESLPDEKVQYNPSVRFTNTQKPYSLELTLIEKKNGHLWFSAWFERPVKKKLFFGLGKEITKSAVVDKWNLPFEIVLTYLDLLLEEKYEALESEMNP